MSLHEFDDTEAWRLVQMYLFWAMHRYIHFCLKASRNWLKKENDEQSCSDERVITAKKTQLRQSEYSCPPPIYTFLHAWLAQLRVVKCNGNLRRCRSSIRTSPNSPHIQFPAGSWPAFLSHCSSSSSFLCLILQPPHPTIAVAYATFITAQVVGGRKLAHWSMSGCTKTYLKQEELSVPWLQARVSEKSRLAQKWFEELCLTC